MAGNNTVSTGLTTPRRGSRWRTWSTVRNCSTYTMPTQRERRHSRPEIGQPTLGQLADAALPDTHPNDPPSHQSSMAACLPYEMTKAMIIMTSAAPISFLSSCFHCLCFVFPILLFAYRFPFLLSADAAASILILPSNIPYTFHDNHELRCHMPQVISHTSLIHLTTGYVPFVTRKVVIVALVLSPSCTCMSGERR